MVANEKARVYRVPWDGQLYIPWYKLQVKTLATHFLGAEPSRLLGEAVAIVGLEPGTSGFAGHPAI